MIRKYKKEGVDELAEIVGGETGNNRLFRERRYNPSLKLALIERKHQNEKEHFSGFANHRNTCIASSFWYGNIHFSK